MELPAVARHLEPAVDARLDADAAMESVARELDDMVAELGQVDLGVASLDFTCKAQQTAGHLGRRGGCRTNVVERFAHVALTDFGLARKRIQEVDAGPHRAEKVVEVVGDARPEPSDGLELATLRDLLLHWIVMGKQQ